MRYQQNAVLITLRQVQQFLDDNSGALTPLNPTARKQLDAVTDQLSALSVEQETGIRGSRGETSRGRALRLSLRQNHMAPIAEIAKYFLQSVPEFSSLTLPAMNVSAQALVASASSMADAATPHAQTFTDNGLSTTFLDELRVAAKAVNDSIVERGNLQGRRNGATAGLAAAEKRGRTMLRVFNALLLKQIGDNAQLRRKWTTATAIPQKPGPTANVQSPATPAGSESAATTTIGPAAVSPVAALVSKAVSTSPTQVAASPTAPASPVAGSTAPVPAAA